MEAPGLSNFIFIKKRKQQDNRCSVGRQKNKVRYSILERERKQHNSSSWRRKKERKRNAKFALFLLPSGLSLSRPQSPMGNIVEKPTFD